MIELKRDELVISFPDVHPEAELRVTFHRTLRIPDDDREYWLPPGLGYFPLRHVDDFAPRIPASWRTHGGVMLPMYQAEAMWIGFESPHRFPFAVKVAAGKICAVSGEQWSEGLHRRPQDYVIVPTQPWLDGFCVGEGVIRQFVAMPLGAGYTAEEQLTGAAEHGGLQIRVVPLKRDVWLNERGRYRTRDVGDDIGSFCEAPSRGLFDYAEAPDMGLAPGGRMRQEIFRDTRDPGEWETAHAGRCFVHLANSEAWERITGHRPPTRPPTAADYTRAGLPWFEWYSEAPAVGATAKLRGLKSVRKLGAEKREAALPENEGVEGEVVVKLRKGGEVREGRF